MKPSYEQVVKELRDLTEMFNMTRLIMDQASRDEAGVMVVRLRAFIDSTGVPR